ncbi:hypothetical protein DPEC_G00006700 [Dallia pectoralis]|uniref:Uncharacterized protein n=1 Tax=Dallia pectoralis TaxID=75939 RepID=A0ACC2HKM6_DALPE|nr:hypothetical protein DPEC_G00006700 [Dallia pectoralis]
MFGTHKSSLSEVRGGRRMSRQQSIPDHQMPKPGGNGAGGGGPGQGPPVASMRRSSSVCSSGVCSSGGVCSGGGNTSNSGIGKMLSLSSMSESIRSGLSCFLSEQVLDNEERQQRIDQQAEIQRLREVRAAAQLKNLEDFLKTNALSLRECVSYTTGMRYR